jgi:hypothetical protein
MRKLILAGACLAGLMAVGCQPTFATTPEPVADVVSTPYCSLNLDTKEEVCADSEAELVAKKGKQPRATYILAKMYDHADYGGSYLEVTASNACDTNSDIDYSIPNVGSTWNDRISSWRGYAQCQIRIYENASFGGASYGAYTNSSYVGAAMNDRTTSIRFY